MLNLRKSALEVVTRQAMLDERYAFYLMMTKNTLDLLLQVLEKVTLPTEKCLKLRPQKTNTVTLGRTVDSNQTLILFKLKIATN